MLQLHRLRRVAQLLLLLQISASVARVTPPRVSGPPTHVRDIMEPGAAQPLRSVLLASEDFETGGPLPKRTRCWLRRFHPPCWGIGLAATLAVFVGAGTAAATIFGLWGGRHGVSAAPVNSTGCQNATDVLIFLTQAKSFDSTQDDCARGCLAIGSCVANCLVTRTGVSYDCGICFGNQVCARVLLVWGSGEECVCVCVWGGGGPAAPSDARNWHSRVRLTVTGSVRNVVLHVSVPEWGKPGMQRLH